MGATLDKLFVDPVDLPNDTYGFIQLLFLSGVYAFVLFKGSNLISDGAEALELVPSLRGIVGAVILPVLGAVPDGAIVLFSGLGDNAKEELNVGVGTLAGSTIMLLTLPWALAVWAGRVDLDHRGQGNYNPSPDADGHPRKLSDKNSAMFSSDAGVNCSSSVKTTANLMLLTILPYLIIQIAAFGYGCYHKSENCNSEGKFPLIGMVFAMFFFAFYLWWQIRHTEGDVLMDHVFELRQRMLDEGEHTPWTLYDHDLTELLREDNLDSLLNDEVLHEFYHFYSHSSETKQEMSYPLTQQECEDLENLSDAGVALRRYRLLTALKEFFNSMDKDHNGTCDLSEVMLRLSKWEISSRAIFDAMDHNADGEVTFPEYVKFIVHYHKKFLEQLQCLDEPHNQSTESDEASQSTIIKEACLQLALGSVLVLLFSDPMCGVLSQLGSRST
eukprot:TRINITY_DN14959_c0_g1_i1.p1 TRINITY_DN14959_c0_g1~~TRINITY_DN14959_c0_g1_i1.p1  ORF type:complete len:443 (-),score=105.99 TRINITY_DN14959_c0_g1_i1:632-1960(-)